MAATTRYGVKLRINVLLQTGQIAGMEIQFLPRLFGEGRVSASLGTWWLEMEGQL
jgi:hypothetical protein